MPSLSPTAASALSPETWPFSLEWLPQPAYLVGGAVRDALLGRQSEYLDLDFVMPAKAVKTAHKISRRCNAGFVLLDEERQIARVVFDGMTVDFAQQDGETLEADLHRRDFTVNAIAYNPFTQEFIDPLQGCADIEAGLIRTISPLNLENDPLRLLRGYRQSAQLGFTIEPATQAAIRQLAPLLFRIAAERVRSELGYLLAIPQGTRLLQAAWEDGLLDVWLPSITEESLARLAGVDRAAVELAQIWPTLGVELSRELRDTLKSSLLAVAKLTCLLDSDIERAQEQLLGLRYSRAESKAALGLHSRLAQLLAEAGAISVREWYFLFREMGPIFPALAVLTVAAGMSVEAIAPAIERYLTPDDLVAHPIPLVTGKDLMAALNIQPGRQVGGLLTEIAIARAEGRISTPEEAVQLAIALLVSPS